MISLLKCQTCKTYTLYQNCSTCGTKTIPPRPPKYSPEDKYAKFRRQVREEEYKHRGLL